MLHSVICVCGDSTPPAFSGVPSVRPMQSLKQQMWPTEEMMSFLIAPFQKGTRAKAPRWKARSVTWMRPRFRCASSRGVVAGSDTIKSFAHAKSTRESKHLILP